jgi:hypothetical protein
VGRLANGRRQANRVDNQKGKPVEIGCPTPKTRETTQNKTRQNATDRSHPRGETRSEIRRSERAPTHHSGEHGRESTGRDYIPTHITPAVPWLVDASHQGYCVPRRSTNRTHTEKGLLAAQVWYLGWPGTAASLAAGGTRRKDPPYSAAEYPYRKYRLGTDTHEQAGLDG